MKFRESAAISLFLAFLTLGIALFYVAVHQSWHFPFHYDDGSSIILNRAIRYLDHPQVFLESMFQRMRPVVNISFAIDYFRGGLSVSIFRGTNFLLHALNISLIGLFAWRFTPRNLIASIATVMLFSLHPLVVESAVYISGRSMLLATFFFLVSLNIALFSPKAKALQIFQYLVFLFFAGMAFFSKESAAILPFILLAVLYWRRKNLKMIFLMAIPCFFLAAVFLYAKSNFINAAWAGFFRFQGDISIYGFWDFLRFQLSLWPRIIRFFFDPSSLSIDHGARLPMHWFEPAVLVGIALILALPCAAFRLRKQMPALSFGLLWIFLSLLPTNSIFPVVDPLAERHLYLALPGFCLAIGSLPGVFPKKYFAPMLILFLGGLVGSFHAMQARSLDWKNNATIWTNAYEKYPEKFRVVINTALGIRQTMDYRGALRILTEFLQKRAYGTLSNNEQRTIIHQIAFAALIASNSNPIAAEALLRESFSGTPAAKFWEELTVLRLYEMRGLFPQIEKRLESLEHFHWASHGQGLAAKDPRFYELELLVVRADLYAARKEWEKLIKLLAPVFTPPPAKKERVEFTSLHFLDEPNSKEEQVAQRISPLWPKRELLANAYEALGHQEKALEELIIVSNHWKTYNIYSWPLLIRIAELYEARKDYTRAADTYGELVRVMPDDKEFREGYRRNLQAIGTPGAMNNAMRQDAQIRYYESARAKLLEEKELVQP